MTCPSSLTSPDATARLTPCVGLCRLDAAGRICLGCGRTLDEIGRWASLDRAARLAVVRQLPRRLASLPLGDRP